MKKYLLIQGLFKFIVFTNITIAEQAQTPVGNFPIESILKNCLNIYMIELRQASVSVWLFTQPT